MFAITSQEYKVEVASECISLNILRMFAAMLLGSVYWITNQLCLEIL